MELRACYPNDMCDIIDSISNYEGRESEVNRPNLERACSLYFSKQ